LYAKVRKKGGTGIKNIRKMNISMLGKYGVGDWKLKRASGKTSSNQNICNTKG
jgi:hypothetical protein